VPAKVALRCDMRIGALSLEAAVVDISLGGMGTLVYDSRVRLEPGMRVERARILHGGSDPVMVDLEITNVTPVVDREGRTANRAGCVIRGSRQTLEELVRMFISDLGEEQS
jgi:c-di-GMP-binding flagellar brake protein YcgR